MTRTSGLRERVYHAMVASAGIFTLALAFWGVQAYQQSEANTPTTVEATRTTITFEEYQAPRSLGTQGTYEYATQGVEFTDSAGKTNGTAALSKEGALCNGGIVYSGEQLASSGSNRLHPYPGVASPLVIAFTNNRVSSDVSFQLLGVGDSKNVVEFLDHTGKVIQTKEYVNTGAGVGCDKKQLVSLSAANIAKVRITQPQNANGDDGLAIDDLSFAALTAPVDQTFTVSVSPTTGTAPLEVTLTYTGAAAIDQAVADGGVAINWGDGTNGVAVAKTAKHTYTAPGTYTITYTALGRTAVATVTVTSQQTASTVLTTDKSTYKPGETVTFTLKNSGPVKVELPNGAPYKISGNGQVIYSPVSTQSVTALEAGKSFSWTWNQKDDAGAQVKDGAYVVAVTYAVNGKSESKSASFTVTSDAKPVDPKGTFSVTPSSGTAPLTVTAKCEGDTITGLVFDFGDGTVTENVTCPTSLTHTYSKEGSYTITVRQGDKVLTTQSVTVSAASVVTTDDGKGKPSALASTGANLLLVILLAAVLSGLVSYFIIRRPFHGDQE